MPLLPQWLQLLFNLGFKMDLERSLINIEKCLRKCEIDYMDLDTKIGIKHNSLLELSRRFDSESVDMEVMKILQKDLLGLIDKYKSEIENLKKQGKENDIS